MNKKRHWREVAIKLGTSVVTVVFLCGALLFAVTLQSVSANAQSTPAAAGKNDIIAIDISLAPDSTMIQHATADNARLLKVFPKGYSLDATHRPHITLVQRFVHTADLDKI